MAAYIYPEVDSFRQRIGEVQFVSGEVAKSALQATCDAVVNHYRLTVTYRPARFALPSEVKDSRTRLIIV